MATRVPGLLSAAMIGGVAVLYIAVIRSQGEVHDLNVVVAFASALFTAAGAALAGALARDPYRRRLAFGIAAAITFVCAWLSGLSIGVFLLPSVLLLMFALGRG
ncbi:MAG: hypothetical protein M3P42_09655 [Actinomycetota bacterium]|nr:hypothetical protein [Actinomycetota bacterium]